MAFPFATGTRYPRRNKDRLHPKPRFSYRARLSPVASYANLAPKVILSFASLLVIRFSSSYIPYNSYGRRRSLSRITPRITMLSLNVAIQRLLLCLLIVGNATDCLESLKNPAIVTPETSTLRSSPLGESKIVTSPSRRSRILDGMTFPKREKLRNSTDANSLDKPSRESDEVQATKNATVTSTSEAPCGPKFPSQESPLTKTAPFRPSVQLPQTIDLEVRGKPAGNPSKDVRRVKFDKSMGANDRRTGGVEDGVASFSSSLAASPFVRGSERVVPLAGRKKNRGKIFDTDSGYGIAVPTELHYYVSGETDHRQQQTGEAMETEDYNLHYYNNNNNDDEAMRLPVGGESNGANFGYPSSHFAEIGVRPIAVGQHLYQGTLTDQQQYDPGVDNAHAIYVKPSKFQTQLATPLPTLRIQHYEYLAPVRSEVTAKPEPLRHHRGGYQLVPHQSSDAFATGNPESVLLLEKHRETAYTRTRHFPYKFYQPDTSLSLQHDNFFYLPEVQHSFMAKQRISPWKKIIHLIGAFLPLGLLLAALKPTIIRVNTQNSTQSGQSLSKLRDLPAEHKRGRLMDNQLDEPRDGDICQDKSICQLIVSGSQTNPDSLQYIVWDIVDKLTEEEARKQGLEDIVAAVKRKDCSTLDC